MKNSEPKTLGDFLDGKHKNPQDFDSFKKVLTDITHGRDKNNNLTVLWGTAAFQYIFYNKILGIEYKCIDLSDLDRVKIVYSPKNFYGSDIRVLSAKRNIISQDILVFENVNTESRYIFVQDEPTEKLEEIVTILDKNCGLISSDDEKNRNMSVIYTQLNFASPDLFNMLFVFLYSCGDGDQPSHFNIDYCTRLAKTLCKSKEMVQLLETFFISEIAADYGFYMLLAIGYALDHEYQKNIIDSIGYYFNDPPIMYHKPLIDMQYTEEYFKEENNKYKVALEINKAKQEHIQYLKNQK